MPIRVDTPSWLSAIRADDKPVYLNSKGAIKTGKSLKGRLVSIAESLGIFKDYVTAYRGREAEYNRDAYAAAWTFVSNKYGHTVRHYTQRSMKNQGYSRALYFERLQGRNPSSSQREVVGRELRLILDTARGIDHDLSKREEVDIVQQQDAGAVVRGNAEVVAQSGTEVMEPVATPEPPDNADGIAENLRDLKISAGDLVEAAEASTPESQIGEVKSKSAREPKEFGLAMVAGNKELLHEMLGNETQLRKLAQELGYDPEAIASRQSYIHGKLKKRIETDPRAKSGRLTPNEILELAHTVFDKALGKSTMVAGIRGAMLDTASKVRHALAEDNPDPLDVLELRKNKIQGQEPLEAAAVAAPVSDTPRPKPKSYKGVDYFDWSDREIRKLGVPVRNHQSAKQVVNDDRYLAASVPEGRRGSELTSAHREYIKTTLLSHVAEHERTKPGILLDAGNLHLMIRPITDRALQMQSGRKLRAMVLYKNVTKHLGRKNTAFSDGLKKMRREARIEAGSKAGLLSFVQGAARKADLNIKIDNRVFRFIRPQVKDMAETYVTENRKALTKADLEYFVQIALRGYSIAERLRRVS